jgi:hypothetical protein
MGPISRRQMLEVTSLTGAAALLAGSGPRVSPAFAKEAEQSGGGAHRYGPTNPRLTSNTATTNRRSTSAKCG